MDWFALTVRGGAEDVAAAQLGRWGVEVMLPMVARRVRGQYGRKARVVARPALPGYLFARLSGGQWPLLRRSSAIHGVVAVDGAPRALTGRDLDRVRAIAVTMQAEADAEAQPRARTVLRRGDRVEVVGTVMAGWAGLVANDRPVAGDRWLVDLGPRVMAIPLDALKVAA